MPRQSGARRHLSEAGLTVIWTMLLNAVRMANRFGLGGFAAMVRSEGGVIFRKILTWVRRHPIISAAIGLSLLLTLYSVLSPTAPAYEYETVSIGRGTVESSVSASGRVRALNTTKVGTEVSGQVVQVLVDYNTPVRRGQVLAIIDPTRFRARVEQIEAQVRAAQAALAQADAALVRARVDIDVQRRDLERRQSLRARGFISEANVDLAQSNYAAARAALSDAGARGQSARAQIAQGTAELMAARLDLRRTTIVAPTAGVVINKLIEPGATVAASFQTPNLFEIASDLTRMQVEASIDEADIGRVRQGQLVRFTVDSYPSRIFAARVREIRQSATDGQNVVTYLVILDVDNRDRALLPGMTANVAILTGRRNNTVRVPTPALLFRPRPGDQEHQPDGGRTATPSVWVATLDPYKPRRREVRLGLQGEDFTEILGGLRPGERVLVRSRSLGNPPEQDPDEEPDS